MCCFAEMVIWMLVCGSRITIYACGHRRKYLRYCNSLAFFFCCGWCGVCGSCLIFHIINTSFFICQCSWIFIVDSNQSIFSGLIKKNTYLHVAGYVYNDINYSILNDLHDLTDHSIGSFLANNILVVVVLNDFVSCSGYGSLVTDSCVWPNVAHAKQSDGKHLDCWISLNDEQKRMK